MRYKYLLPIILLMFFMPFYSAQNEQVYSTDPQMANYISGGYVITPISISKGKINNDIYLNFRVYNDAGKVISTDNANINCSVFMFSPEGDRVYRFDGNEELNNISDTGRLAMIPGSFMNETGYYKWYVACQNTNTDFGGAMQGELLVTLNGEPLINPGQGITIFSSLLVILTIGILFVVGSMKMPGVPSRIVFAGLGAVCLISATLFSVVILTNVMEGYSNIISGISTFWVFIKTLVGIGVLALVLYAGLKSLELWQFKRGFKDD